MKCTILGSGACAPTKKRALSGYVLSYKKQNILIDSGAGALLRLASTPIKYFDISRVYYSHWHPDHIGDLESFLFALNDTPGFIRTRELHIIGPVGFLKFFRELQKVYPWITAKTYPCHVEEVSNEIQQFRNMTVQSQSVEHSSIIPSVAYRFSCQHGTFVFSGDTKVCDAILELAINADVLIIEASVPLDIHNPGNHLTAEQAGRIARLANVKNVVLTHFYPVCEQYDMRSLCAKEFKGNIILAEDLMEISLTADGLVVGHIS